jgi:hypothetical protein
MLKPTEWRVIKQTPSKRILARYDAATDEMVFCEEWLEDAHFREVQRERERPRFANKDVRPLAIIPDSVLSRAINEGWVNDSAKWAKWAKDVDNRKVQI